MNEKCRQLGSELAEVKELRGDFARELEVGVRSGDLNGEELSNLRDVINALLKGDTELAKLRENMVSPGLEHLKLREQYDAQVKVAWKSGLFGLSPENRKRLLTEDKDGRLSGLSEPLLNIIAGSRNSLKNLNIPGLDFKFEVDELPVIERTGQKYPMPGWKEVQKILRKPENREIIKEKSAQGFTQMLLVPFGCDLQIMAQKFKTRVKELDEEGLNPDGSSNPQKGIFGAGGEKVEFERDDDDNDSVNIWESWDESQMVYYPKKYDKKDHGGITKEDAIQINGAWQICFVEDLEKMAVIPEGADDQKDVIGGRRRMDRKGSFIKAEFKDNPNEPRISEYKSAMDDKEKLTNPNAYEHEIGFTPEKYLWMQLTSLLAKEKPVLMDYENNEWRGTYLTSCYNDVFDHVPIAFWNEPRRWIILGGKVPGSLVFDCGARSSVDISR